MDQEQLRTLLEEVRAGATPVDSALERMRHLPFEDLGYAKLDHHRALRHGITEVIFGKGKTPDQVAGRPGPSAGPERAGPLRHRLLALHVLRDLHRSLPV